MGRVGSTTRPTRSADVRLQQPPQLRFGNPVFRGFPTIHNQHGYLETVLAFERGIGGDVDFGQPKRLIAANAHHERLHLVAEMASGTRVDRNGRHGAEGRHDAAIASAAESGSGAAIIGRPTTR